MHSDKSGRCYILSDILDRTGKIQMTGDGRFRDPGEANPCPIQFSAVHYSKSISPDRLAEVSQDLSSIVRRDSHDRSVAKNVCYKS